MPKKKNKNYRHCPYCKQKEFTIEKLQRALETAYTKLEKYDQRPTPSRA